jgi:hypothetical protein
VSALSGEPYSTELRRLDPRRLRFFRHGAILRLTVEGEFSVLKVSVVRAFPLRHPNCFYSVLDGGNRDVGVIADPSALDPDSRRLVEEALRRRYHLPRIRRVLNIRERFGTEEWHVETDRGECFLTTRNLHDNTAQPDADRLLITDVDGNRFEIPSLSAVDPVSRRFLDRHL